MGQSRDEEWRHATRQLFGAYQDATNDVLRQVDWSLRLLARAMLVLHVPLLDFLVEVSRRYAAGLAPVPPVDV